MIGADAVIDAVARARRPLDDSYVRPPKSDQNTIPDVKRASWRVLRELRRPWIMRRPVRIYLFMLFVWCFFFGWKY